jgi:hypothetical protein
MTTARKLKVSLSLSEDVVALVDRQAARLHESRSGVIEQWLRRAGSAAAEKEIEQATVAYYRSLRDADRADDEALSRASSAAARRVKYDEPSRGRNR